jgi:DNA polymerase V
MTIYALVDGVAFFASCEAVFRPDLRPKGVLIFSNNDGVCVALNEKAKQLGFKKFKSYFELKPLIDKHKAVVCSSNYELYGCLSKRMMDTLATFSSDHEVYSIDETWLDFTGHSQLRETGHKMIATVLSHTGLETRVGFGSNKTLCKIASVIAKRVKKANGVCCIDDDNIQRRAILARFPVDEVWGVGKRTAEKLKRLNIYSALELADYDKNAIRNQFGITIERTSRELNGQRCFNFHEDVTEQKQIIVSRSFGKPIYDLQPLQSITISYLEKAMKKLRANNQLVRHISVSASTSKFSKDYSSIQSVITLPTHTNDTLIAAQLVSEGIEQCYKRHKFVRSMICLTSLHSNTHYQSDLLEPEQSKASRSLMKVIDTLNAGNQKNIFLARSPKKTEWDMRREFKSPEYTTKWRDLPKIRC